MKRVDSSLRGSELLPSIVGCNSSSHCTQWLDSNSRTIFVYLWICLLVGAGLVSCFQKSSGTVTRVYDGDSIVLANGDEIRLIGIDAPEKGDPGADESRMFLDKLIYGKTIRLESDKEDKDKYNRLLRYVYIGETFVNAEMVRNGYAVTLFIPPNDKYREEFTRLEATAKESKKGLWASGGVMQTPKVSETPQGDVISWKDAGNYIGQIKTVEGLIVRTYNSGKACFLNFDPDYKKGYFEVVIFPDDYAKFSEPPEKLYLDKNIRVRGRIKEYQGKPEIILKDPGQIEISGKTNQSEEANEITVYVTKDGSKYHRADCEWLSKSKIPIKLKDARAKYGPCKVCKPPE